jgi:hypothetical protein
MCDLGPEIDALIATLNAAQAAHARLLKYDARIGGFVAQCDERTLHLAYVAALEAESAYLLACDAPDEAQQVEYQLEIERERFRRACEGM